MLLRRSRILDDNLNRDLEDRPRSAAATRADPVPRPAATPAVGVVAAAGILALTLLLAACGEDDPRSRTDAGGTAPGGGPSTAGDLPTSAPGPATPEPFPPASTDPARMARDEAVRAADAWAQAQKTSPTGPAFVVVTPVPEQTGNWEPQNRGFKGSLLDGCFEMRPSATVPPHPADGQVRRADGTVFTRPFLAPQDAFGRSLPPELRSRCGTSTTPRLPVTGISLTTGTLVTTDGPATVPVWELTFEGTAVRGRAAAVPGDPAPPARPVGTIGPPADGGDAKATLSPDGRTLTLAFFGSPDQPGPCGEDYTIETVQRADVVVVAIVRHRHAPADSNVECTLIAATRTASVTLDAPLGSRALIGTRGLPVARS